MKLKSRFRGGGAVKNSCKEGGRDLKDPSRAARATALALLRKETTIYGERPRDQEKGKLLERSRRFWSSREQKGKRRREVKLRPLGTNGSMGS